MISVSDRYKRQASSLSPPSVALEVFAYKQFFGRILSTSTGSTVYVDGNASTFFSVGDTVIVTSRLITSEFSVQSVAYGAGTTALVLSGFTYASDDLDAHLALQYILTEYLTETALGKITKSVESSTLNEFTSGKFKLDLDNENRALFNESAKTGLFMLSTYSGSATQDPTAVVLTDSAASLPDVRGTWLEMLTGLAAGSRYKIASSSDTSITIASGDDLTTDNVRSGDQYQVSLDTVIWITVKIGWQGLTGANERPIIVGGVVDNRSVTYDRFRRRLSVQVYGYLKRLDYMAAYEVAEDYGAFPHLTGVTLVSYDPAEIGAQRFGPRTLEYRYPDGEALSGIEIVHLNELDAMERPRLLRFRRTDQFSWDLGPWTTVDSTSDLDSSGEKKLSSMEWEFPWGGFDDAFPNGVFKAKIKFGSSSNLTRYPNHYAEDLVMVEVDDETGERTITKGKPTLQFDGGVKLQAITTFQAVLRDEQAGDFTDFTAEAITPYGTAFDLFSQGDALYLGSINTFAGVFFRFSVASPSAYTGFKVYYSKGYDNWVEISPVTDNTNGFQGDGWIQWTIPSDWRKTSVFRDADEDEIDVYDGLYWVKIESDVELPLVYLKTFGENGTGDGEFDTPRDVAIDGDYIYVTDSNNDRVQIWTRAATPVFVDEFGSYGTGDGEFNSPWGIDIDDSYIYVSDSSNNRVQVFEKASPYTHVRNIGVGHLAVCHQISVDHGAYDEEDYVYVAGNNDFKVWVFQKNGDLVTSFQPFMDLMYRRPEAVIPNADKTALYVVNTGLNDAQTDSHVIRKVNFSYTVFTSSWDTSVIWEYGVFAASNPDYENGEWHYPRNVSTNGSYLTIPFGVGGLNIEQGVVMLLDNGATVDYVDHIENGGDDDDEFSFPTAAEWVGPQMFIANSVNDNILIYGWEIVQCWEMRRLIGLIGRDEDQLTVNLDYTRLPAGNVRETVVIKHDAAGDPAPATWFELITAQELAERLLDQANFPSGIRSIDDMKLVVETPMIFFYGKAPYYKAKQPITAMDWDADNDTLYVGAGLEIFRVTESSAFELVCKVPDPGDGHHHHYQMWLFKKVTIAGEDCISGIAIHPYGPRYHQQYGCPSVRFRYNITNEEFDAYDTQTGYGDFSEDDRTMAGIPSGTHCFRNGRNANPYGFYTRRLGQYELTVFHSLVPGLKKFGENVPIPYDQLLATNYLTDGTPRISLQPVHEIVAMDEDPNQLFYFISKAYGGDLPRGRPYYWVSPGFYSIGAHTLALNPYGDPFMLRWTFGQEGVREYMDFTEHPLASGEDYHHYLWFMNIWSWLDPDTLFNLSVMDLGRDDAEWGLTYMNFGHDGADLTPYTENPLCSAVCESVEQLYLATILFPEYRSGGASMGICRLWLFDMFYFHPTPAASLTLDTLQGAGVCRFYDGNTQTWEDVSEAVSTWESGDPSTFEINHSDDAIYLGFHKPFTAIYLTVKDSDLISDNNEVEYFSSFADPNDWKTFPHQADSSSSFQRDGTSLWGWTMPLLPLSGDPDWEPWIAENWADLTNLPGTPGTLADTADLYWVRLTVSGVGGGECEMGKIWGRLRILWDGYDESTFDNNGITILGMAIHPTEGTDGWPVIHGCYWNRDDGGQTSCDDPLQYKWFCYDTGNDTMTTEDSLTDNTDCSTGQFKGFVYDSSSDAIFAVYTNPNFRDSGSFLVKGTFDSGTSTITLEKSATIPAPDWGIAGRLLATGDGRIYGVTHPSGFLWHFDTVNYPRLSIADFGSTMSIRKALVHLCQISNCTIRATPDKQIVIERRDNEVAASSIDTIETKNVVQIEKLDVWPHRYDGVSVNYRMVDGRAGEETFGQVDWDKRILSISNPFIQDPHLARTLAMTYALFYVRARRVLKIKIDYMLWFTLRDVLKFALPTDFLDIAVTQGFWLNKIKIDNKTRKIGLEAIEWFGEET